MNSMLHKLGLDGIDIVSLRNQLSRIRLVVIVCFAAGLVGIIGVYAASQVTGKPASWLTRDPLDVIQSAFYIGVLSNVGIMLWSAATAVCFLGAFVLWFHNRCRQSALFLLFSGILCLMLTVDDTFMLHERVLPKHLHLPEVGIFVGYLAVLVGYCVYFVRRILSTEYLLLVLALFFLGLSSAMDQILPFTDLETFFEDSVKFIGIVFWLAYFFRTTSVAISGCFTGSERDKEEAQT